MTGSIKRPDITEVGSSALILKRFERSEAVERLERLEPSYAPAQWKDALAQLDRRGIPNGDRGEMRGLGSGLNLDFIAFNFPIAVTAQPNAIPCTFGLFNLFTQYGFHYSLIHIIQLVA
jgi:hypothetical protein